MSRAIQDYNSVDWHSKFYYDPTSPTGLRWKVDNNVGNPKCKRKACKYREDKIAELNALGYGYSENHGK